MNNIKISYYLSNITYTHSLLENSKETIQFLTPTKIWLHRFGGCVLGGKLEAVRAHGLDARQCAGVGYHVP